MAELQAFILMFFGILLNPGYDCSFSALLKELTDKPPFIGVATHMINGGFPWLIFGVILFAVLYFASFTIKVFLIPILLFFRMIIGVGPEVTYLDRAYGNLSPFFTWLAISFLTFVLFLKYGILDRLMPLILAILE